MRSTQRAGAYTQRFRNTDRDPYLRITRGFTVEFWLKLPKVAPLRVVSIGALEVASTGAVRMAGNLTMCG